MRYILVGTVAERKLNNKPMKKPSEMKGQKEDSTTAWCGGRGVTFYCKRAWGGGERKKKTLSLAILLDIWKLNDMKSSVIIVWNSISLVIREGNHPF